LKHIFTRTEGHTQHATLGDSGKTDERGDPPTQLPELDPGETTSSDPKETKRKLKRGLTRANSSPKSVQNLPGSVSSQNRRTS